MVELYELRFGHQSCPNITLTKSTISSISVEPSWLKSEHSSHDSDRTQSTIKIISITFNVKSLFKSLGTTEHSIHSEVSCELISSGDKQSGYGGHKELLLMKKLIH